MIKKLIHYLHYEAANIQLWYAIRLANKAHVKNKIRYYVMPDANNKLVVMNRKGFRYYKKRGRISHKAKVRDMLKECFYFTPDSQGSTQMTTEIQEAKRLMWLEYYFESKNRKIPLRISLKLRFKLLVAKFKYAVKRGGC